jgi:hypothetical protein
LKYIIKLNVGNAKEQWLFVKTQAGSSANAPMEHPANEAKVMGGPATRNKEYRSHHACGFHLIQITSYHDPPPKE